MQPVNLPYEEANGEKTFERTKDLRCIFVCPSMSLVYYVKHRSSMIEQSEPEMKLDLTQTNNLVCCVDTGD